MTKLLVVSAVATAIKKVVSAVATPTKKIVSAVATSIQKHCSNCNKEVCECQSY